MTKRCYIFSDVISFLLVMVMKRKPHSRLLNTPPVSTQHVWAGDKISSEGKTVCWNLYWALTHVCLEGRTAEGTVGSVAPLCHQFDISRADVVAVQPFARLVSNSIPAAKAADQNGADLVQWATIPSRCLGKIVYTSSHWKQFCVGFVSLKFDRSTWWMEEKILVNKSLRRCRDSCLELYA